MVSCSDGPIKGNENGQNDPNASTYKGVIVLNELCGNKVLQDAVGADVKFIELFNNGASEVSLEGWTMRKYAADATDEPEKYDIVWTAPAGTKMGAGAYLVLLSDQKEATAGFNAGLSAKKEVWIEIYDNAGKLVDKFVRGKAVTPFLENGLAENKEASFSRVPNGTGEWAYAVPTPNAINGNATGVIEHE